MKQVGPRVERLAQHLFRRHVNDCTQCGAGAGQMLGAHTCRCTPLCYMPVRRRRRDLGQSKIEDLGMSTLSYENVCRLDISMHNALGVRGVECVRHFDREGEQPL
jgi:hypothetical protein